MSSSAPTVLLIEDNEDNRIVYSTILRHYGFRVREAHTGEDGVQIARDESPDLILMDVGLPGIAGWEATSRLRSDERTRSIPIIALTAHALAEHRARSLEVGCDDYLAKPVEPREVLAAVQRHLERTRLARGASATIRRRTTESRELGMAGD